MRQVDLRCDQYESSTPYYAFRPFLRSLLDVQLNGGGEHNRDALSERLVKIDPELVPWAPLLAAPLDVEVASTPQVDDLDPSFWRARLHGVMGTLLGLVLDSPTLLVFDDVHWMDEASSELLRYLGTQLPTKPWLACTTRRPGNDGFAAATGTPPLPALTLRLEPLPEEDARALAVAAAGDRRLTDDEVAALMERAAGNPLFLRELASTGDKSEVAEDLPDTVETLVATRIDQLAPRDRALLRWASVLGERFSGSLIADVLENESDVAAGSEAWDRLGEFVERDPDVAGAFRFRHALIRDAAYEGLSFKRRRELHERVAHVIERGRGDDPDGAAELLSLHYFNAGVWDRAFEYSRRAGDQARAIHANADAARFYERAAESGQQASEVDRGELGEVWRSLGLALDVTGEFERAMGAFKRAIRLLEDDPDAQAAVYQARAKSLMRLGNYSGALRETTSGLKLVDPNASQEALARSAQLTAIRAEIRLEQGRAREALQLARQAADAAEASRAREALARAYTVIDNAFQQLGEPKKALLERLAVEIYREIGELRAAAIVEMNLGVQAYAEGRWTEAIELYESAERELRRIGDMANAAFVRANMGEILISRGELERAREVLEDARDVLRSFHFVAPAVFADIQLGRLECEAGRTAEAVEALRGAVAEARELHHPYLVVDASVHLSTAHRHNGEPEPALQVLDDIGELEGDDVLVLGARIGLTRAAALVDVGNSADAAIALEGALALARDQEQLHEIAEVLLARADLARAAGLPPNDKELEEANRLLQLFRS
jgi:predicted ATPase